MINNAAADRIAKSETIENTLIVGQTSREIVKLDNSYVRESELLNHDPLIRVTNGTYFVKYEPKGNFAHDNRFPYVIGNDLVGFIFKVKNSAHFRSLRKIFPEVNWMFRNTNYSAKLFYAAKLHPGMPMTFCVNWGDYVKELSDKMIKDGVDTTMLRPLVTFRAPKTKWNYIMDDKSFAPNRRVYAKEIAEAKRIAPDCSGEY